MKVTIKNIAVLLWLVFLAQNSYGQIGKDTLALKEVNVVKPGKNKTGIQKITSYDSIALAQYKTSNLADLLSTNNSVFMKSYGPGLGTISLRGTGSSQTKIFWNDIPVGSSAGGVFDFTLVSNSTFDNAQVLYGNSSLQKGIGGLGGSVQLQNNITMGKNDVDAGYSIGSFGTQKGYADASYGDSHFTGATKIFFDKAENNYSYYNLAKFGFPEETQSKAAGALYGGIQQLAWQPTTKDIFTGMLWYQTFSRDIAQPMTSVNGRQWKNDSSTRLYFGYGHKFNKIDWQTKAAFTDEAIHYRDYLSGIDEKSQVKKLFFKTDATAELSHNINIETSLQYVDDKAISDGFIGDKFQQRVSGYASFSQALGSFQYLAMAREETVNNVFYPAAFNLALMQDILSQKHLQFRISGGRNFNYPALYDLYWVPGGNPDLKPELAYTGDASLLSEIKLNQHTHLNSELTTYASDITNQIIWLPKDKGYYEAQNLKKVNTSGLELNEGIEYRNSNTLLGASAGYSYVNSITKSSLRNYDLSEGKQLIYVPKQTFYSALKGMYKNWTLLLEYSYTGLRYTTPDNSISLPGYGLVNLTISKTITYKKIKTTLHIKCRNIFDVEYQTIQWYPMPGRYIEAGISVHI